MLNIFYANQIAHIPVRIIDSTGLPVNGATLSAATALKADGSTNTVSGGVLNPIDGGAFANQGVYEFVLPAGYTDQPGPLTIAISDGTNVAIVVIGIVLALSADAIANVWAAA